MIFVQRRRSILWTPTNTTTESWLAPYDSSTTTIVSGAFTEVRDRKGNGRNFPSAAGSRPTITANALNGKASMSFNGSQWLTFSGAAAVWNMFHTAAGAGATVVAVWRAGTNSDPNAAYALLGNSAIAAANHGFGVIYDDRVGSSRNNAVVGQIVRGVSGQPTAQNVSANNTHPVNAPVIITHIGNPGNATAASRSILRVNGTAIQNNTFTNAPSSTNASFPLQIGAAGNNASPLVGDIYEVVILPPGTVLATAERVEGYLAGPVAGWNLQGSLAAGHPYKFAAPTL